MSVAPAGGNVLRDAKIAELRRKGLTLQAIAKSVGLSHVRVRAILKDQANRPRVEVPKWVPDDLRAYYLDVAQDKDEETAASLVRRIKRERGGR